jgi:peptidoglycan/xylan/chitin deacetylase (PgdA/CDA1 family)
MIIRYSARAVRRLINFSLRHIMGTITHFAVKDRLVALTFDDGPHPESTPRLLDILEKHHAHATFFVIGEAAQRHPELLHRIARSGHAICNHSWDHPSFPNIAGYERRAQIRACAKAIAPYGQRFFRPPYGYQSVLTRLDALLLGYKVVTWNILAEDWLDHDPDSMFNKVMNKIRPGSVILFHDTLHDVLELRYANRKPTLDAVKMLLERIGDDFRFVTIPDLFRSGRPYLTNWVQRPDVDLLNSLMVKRGTARRYAMKRG